jgi:hypothetical protein
MRLLGRCADVGRIDRILLVVAASVERFAPPNRVGWFELVAAAAVTEFGRRLGPVSM